MSDKLLLDPKKFIIDNADMDEEKNALYCKNLIEKWTPQLEKEMLEAFIRLYYDDMHEQWGPDDEEESKEYWPEIKTPEDRVDFIGTDVVLYALEDAVYAKKEGCDHYKSQNVDVCVILGLNCPWDEDHGWAAVFIDEKFVKVDQDIVDCVWLN